MGRPYLQSHKAVIGNIQFGTLFFPDIQLEFVWDLRECQTHVWFCNNLVTVREPIVIHCLNNCTRMYALAL